MTPEQKKALKEREESVRRSFREAMRHLATVIDKEAESYDRNRDLVQVLPVWPEDAPDPWVDVERDPQGAIERTKNLIRRLEAVERDYRQLGLRGDWVFSTAHHRMLIYVLQGERKVLVSQEAAANAMREAAQ